MPPKKKLVWNETYDVCNRHYVKTEPPCKYKNFNSVIKQMIQEISKDSHRKVCKGCHEIGHHRSDVNCKLKIEQKNRLKHKIKKYMLSQDCLSGKTTDEHFVELSMMYEISIHMCKTLYEEIPPIELVDRRSDINVHVQEMKKDQSICHPCNKIMYTIHINTHRIWKGNSICDSCWSEHEEERDILWKKISGYKKLQCKICCTTKMKQGERYHYDHINMFDKENSICSMVNEGNTIEDIYLELDKCQVLCLSCHHIVTNIESKFGFTRIKQILTRKLNHCEITEEEYTQQKKEIGEIYVKKMYEIYDELKKCI
jgi:hypothetical protein